MKIPRGVAFPWAHAFNRRPIETRSALAQITASVDKVQLARRNVRPASDATARFLRVREPELGI